MRGAGFHQTSEATRAGSAAASNRHGARLSNQAPNTARLVPTASSTAHRSETLVSRIGRPAFLLDKPVPRQSCKIRRENEASPSNHSLSHGCSHHTSRLPPKSNCQAISTGPSPTTWYAMYAPSGVFTYWGSGTSTVAESTPSAANRPSLLVPVSRRAEHGADHRDGVSAGIRAGEAVDVEEAESELRQEFGRAGLMGLTREQRAWLSRCALLATTTHRIAASEAAPARGADSARDQSAGRLANRRCQFSRRSVGRSAWPRSWPRLAAQGRFWPLLATLLFAHRTPKTPGLAGVFERYRIPDSNRCYRRERAAS